MPEYAASPVLAPYDRDRGHKGILVPDAPGHYTTPVAVTASTSYYARFMSSRAMVITKIAFQVTTADANNPGVDVGIADATGARLSHSAATTGVVNVIGRSVIPLLSPVLLVPGVVYYAAWASAASATPATLQQAVLSNYAIFGFAIPEVETGIVAGATIAASSGALSATGSVPALALLEAGAI